MARVRAGVQRGIGDILVAFVCWIGFGAFGSIVLSLASAPHWVTPVWLIVAGLLAITSAGMIRGYLDGPRAWVDERYDDLEIWLFDHPVASIAPWAGFGVLLTSYDRRLTTTLLSMVLWTGIGAFHTWRWHRRVAAVRASH